MRADALRPCHQITQWIRQGKLAIEVLVVYICIYLIGIHNQKKPMLIFIKNNNSYEVQSYCAGHTLTDVILHVTHTPSICVGGNTTMHQRFFSPARRRDDSRLSHCCY